MSDYRLGDDRPPVSRSARVFEDQGAWFFRTREGRAMGPFDTKEEAEQGLQDFIEFVQVAPLDAIASLTDSLTPDDERDD